MKSLILHAEFKAARAMPKAIVPTFEVEVEFALLHAGAGQSFLLPDNAYATVIHQVAAYLHWSTEGDMDWTRGFLAVGTFAPAMMPVNLREPDMPSAVTTLAFPLTTSAVARIENLRAGRKAKFRVHMRLAGYSTGIVDVMAPPEGPEGPVTKAALTKAMRKESLVMPFYIDRLYATVGPQGISDLEVQKSQWVEEILPGLGFGAWKVYEIPASDIPALEKVDDYVENAAKHFNAGDWKDSMARSRDAVQALEPYLRKYANEAYSDKKGSADEKTAALVASFSGLASSMLDFQSKVFSVLSAGSHPLPAGTTVERPDAEFGLTVAMACRRYVGQRMREGPFP